MKPYYEHSFLNPTQETEEETESKVSFEQLSLQQTPSTSIFISSEFPSKFQSEKPTSTSKQQRKVESKQIEAERKTIENQLSWKPMPKPGSYSIPS